MRTGQLRFIKVLMLCPIIVCLVATLVASDIFKKHEEVLFQTRMQDCMLFVEVTANHIDRSINRDNDWDSIPDFYRDWVIWSAEFADYQPFTIGIALDDSLNLLSSRIYDTTNAHLQYDPLKDSVFVNAILNDSIGFVTLNYPEFGDLVVYFRWIPSPSDKVKESKFLLAVGMLYEIEDDYTHVITPLIVVLIVVTLFINYVLLFFVNHYYYEKEKIKSKQNNE